MYFEDFHKGMRLEFGSCVVDPEEMLSFSRQWDTLPIHVDDAAMTTAHHGGLIASGELTMALKQRLISRHPMGHGVIGAIGHDEVRFLKPVRAGDELTMSGECVEVLPAVTKPDRGIVKIKMQMRNQRDELVLAYFDIVMFARRPGV
jgi:acyl dehydratase